MLIFLEGASHSPENFLADLKRTADPSFKNHYFKGSYIGGTFYRLYLLFYYFVIDRPQFALMNNIRVGFNRANCRNFQIDKRNLDKAVSASSNRLFFLDLLIIIFLRAKADNHY